MDNILFGGGKTKLDPATIQAARKALASPCCICSSTSGITARQFTPRKPKLFLIPDGMCLVVPLCAVCLDIDAVDIEAHLLTTRIMQAAENFGSA